MQGGIRGFPGVRQPTEDEFLDDNGNLIRRYDVHDDPHLTAPMAPCKLWGGDRLVGEGEVGGGKGSPGQTGGARIQEGVGAVIVIRLGTMFGLARDFEGPRQKCNCQLEVKKQCLQKQMTMAK